MQKLFTLFMMAVLIVINSVSVWGDDSLAKIRKQGVLVAGVKDSTPPFGYIEENSLRIIGYDIDIVKAIARKMGVRVELKAVTSSNRIPLLQNGQIDMIAATMTKSAERAKLVDFSYAYFITGQKFIARKGSVRSLRDLAGKRIGSVKGSTSERNAREALPTATVVHYEDYQHAMQALQHGKLFSITTDEAILAGIMARLPQRGLYEIPNLQISDELYGLAMRKDDRRLVTFVNKSLLEMEKSGEAARIYNRWFGMDTGFHLKRSFRITARK